jgi:alkylresorcinol/alkylpyrone synthase
MLTGRPGLVITAEICTATFFPAPEHDLENTVANAIFSDGACACLIGVDENPKHPWIWAFASEFDPQYVDYLGFGWEDGRLKVKLHKDVPKVAPELAERVVKRILAPLGLSLREIDHFIIHPGGVKVLNDIRDRLEIPEEKLVYSRQILRQQGNQSSATIASIGRLAKEKAKPGDWGLVLTLGAGFKTYAILLYWA